jgi:DNA-directed RNA polymerase specialized sigma24 family protein
MPFVLKRPKYLVGNKPFSRLPLKQRAIFILYMAGLTYNDLQQLSIASPRTISKVIKRAYEEYNN